MNDKSSLLDIRVRERNLKRGLLDAKEVEKYQNELPDLSDQTDLVTLPQPALSGSRELDRGLKPPRAHLDRPHRPRRRPPAAD